MIQTLTNLIEDEKLRKMVGERGRKTVLDHYSKDVKDQYYQLYNSLIEKHEKNSTLI